MYLLGAVTAWDIMWIAEVGKYNPVGRFFSAIIIMVILFVSIGLGAEQIKLKDKEKEK